MIDGRPIRIGCMVPAYGGNVAAEHLTLWLQLGHLLASSETRYALFLYGSRDVCGVHEARSLIVRDAIEAGCDWILMLDADTWVEDPRSLLVMISHADRQDAAIVGAAVRRQGRGNEQPKLNIYRGGEGFQDLPRTDGLFSVDRIGGAVFAINLGHPAIGRMDPGPTVFRFHGSVSEDHDYCDRVRTSGGTILCDGRVETKHRMRPLALSSHEYRVHTGDIVPEN